MWRHQFKGGFFAKPFSPGQTLRHQGINPFPGGYGCQGMGQINTVFVHRTPGVKTAYWKK
jgi:hypothetical protein